MAKKKATEPKKSSQKYKLYEAAGDSAKKKNKFPKTCDQLPCAKDEVIISHMSQLTGSYHNC